MSTLWLLLCIITNVLSQSNNSHITTAPSSTPPFSEASVYCMIFIGIIGMILIPTLAGHTFYNFRKRLSNQRVSLLLYGIYFSVNWMICIGYAFFKSDIIFPMGNSIDCKIGQYFISYFQLFSLISLIAVFIRRIHASFNESALAYNRGFLLFILISYACFRIVGNIFYVTLSYDAITLVKLPSGIGICTLGHNFDSDDMEKFIMSMAINAFIEIIYLILICAMFVYKLNKVVKMTDGLNNEEDNENKLKRLMKKQTILVCIACVSTILMWVAGATIPSIGILLHIDTIVNSVCVWLMFKFSDKVWNKIVSICCCCCCKQDLMLRLYSLSNVYSNRSTKDPENINQNGTSDSPSDCHIIPNKIEGNDVVIEITHKGKNVKSENIVTLPTSNAETEKHKSKSVEVQDNSDTEGSL
eukprot:139010_1